MAPCLDEISRSGRLLLLQSSSFRTAAGDRHRKGVFYLLVSTKGRYGLRSMVDLAVNHQDGPLPLRVIAERQEISESYLEQVFANLRKAGLVKAVRGSSGGYVLAKPASEITVEEILTALEGPMIPVNCVKDTESTPCPRMNSCFTFPLWKTLADKISEVLSSTTLQDLADQART